MAEAMSRISQPLVTIVLARLLSPKEFGVVAVAVMIIGFSQVVWEAGLGKALIQAEKDISEIANVAFWTNITLGILIYLVISFLSPTFARIFNAGTVEPVLKVLGIQIVIQAFSIVHNSLFQRALNFKILFYIRIITSLVPVFVSIPLALHDFGVWSLVYGALVGSVFQTCLLWILSAWRPSLRFNWLVARRVWRFGFWILLEGILGWFYNWADSMLLGAYLGITDLGLYGTGTTVVVMAFGIFLNPLLPILFSAFSRLQNDLVQFNRYFSKAVRIIISIALPLTVGIFFLSHYIETVVFGGKWEGIGRVIAFMAIVQGWSWFATGINYEAYRSLGRPDIYPKVLIFALLYYLPIYFYAAPKGIEVFLWARLFLVFVGFPLHIWILVRLLKVSPFFLWVQSKVAWLAVFAMAIVLFTATRYIMPSCGNLVEQITFGGFLVLLSGATYGAVIAIFDRKFIYEIKEIFLKLI